jgi:mRNA interferase RelE/StbE
VTYEVTWSVPALDRAAGYLRDDPDGVEAVLDAADDLAEDPRPDPSLSLGDLDLRRLRVGRYRLLFEIDEDARQVVVVHLGRLG